MKIQSAQVYHVQFPLASSDGTEIFTTDTLDHDPEVKVVIFVKKRFRPIEHMSYYFRRSIFGKNFNAIEHTVFEI